MPANSAHATTQNTDEYNKCVTVTSCNKNKARLLLFPFAWSYERWKKKTTVYYEREKMTRKKWTEIIYDKSMAFDFALYPLLLNVYRTEHWMWCVCGARGAKINKQNNFSIVCFFWLLIFANIQFVFSPSFLALSHITSNNGRKIMRNKCLCVWQKSGKTSKMGENVFKKNSLPSSSAEDA